MKVCGDFVAAAGFFALSIALAIPLNPPLPGPEDMGFSYEYGNIAEALVRGDGFSDPFQGSSGPTAWMPPAYPVLIAAIFEVFGVRSTTSAWCLLTIKLLGVSLSLYLLLRAAARLPYPRYRRLGVTILFALMLSVYGDLPYFLGTTDSWLNVLLASAVVHALGAAIYSEKPGAGFYLAGLGALLPMANPILAFAAAVALVAAMVLLWRRREFADPTARLLRRAALFAGFFAITTAIWTYRNYTVFGSIIFVKSNLVFDFYQANILDDDGIVSFTTFQERHPMWPNPMREAYLEKGESVFLRERRTELWTDIRKAGVRPLVAKTLNRFRNAYLYTQDPADLLKPQEAGPVRAAARLAKRISKGILIGGAPLLAILICLADSRMRRNPVLLAVAATYIAYLAPFVVVSHYARYQETLIGVQALSFFAAATAVIEWRAGRSSNTAGGSVEQAEAMITN